MSVKQPIIECSYCYDRFEASEDNLGIMLFEIYPYVVVICKCLSCGEEHALPFKMPEEK